MRVTNILRTEQTIHRMQGNLARLNELQTQIATGRRFNRVAEDPYAASQVLRIERSVRALDQFAKNATGAQVRLGAEEAVVTQLDDLLREARDFALGFGLGDPPFTPTQTAERQVAADQLTRLLDDSIALANTKIGNEYILAGGATTTPAFDTTPGATYGDYQGTTVQRRIEIADGVFVPVNHTGDQFVGPAIAALKALRDAVDPANAQPESQVLLEVQNVFATSQGLQLSLAETGTVGSQIASTEKRNRSIENDLETTRGRLQDINLEESVARLLSLQTTIEASYSATSRLLTLSLTDYLR